MLKNDQSEQNSHDSSVNETSLLTGIYLYHNSANQRKTIIRCAAPTCTKNNQSLPNRKDLPAKKASLLNRNFLDFSTVEQGEKTVIKSLAPMYSSNDQSMPNRLEKIPLEIIFFFIGIYLNLRRFLLF